MVMHIVTSRCFLACEKVTSVHITEMTPDEVPLPKKSKPKKGRPKKTPVKENGCRISINYYPLSYASSTNYNGREPIEFSLEVMVPNKEKAFLLYGEIVKEIQEQHPTEGYLDQLVGKLLASDEFQVNDDKSTIDNNF